MHHRSLVLLAAVVLAMSASSSASAAALSLENSELGITVSGLGGVTLTQVAPSIPITVAGNGSFTEPASVFSGSATAGCANGFPTCGTGAFTAISLISGLRASVANGTQTILPGGGPGGGVGGTGALSGLLQISVLGGLVIIPIPLSPVGVGGTAMTTTGSIMVTVFGTGWTTGTALVTGISTTITTPTFSGTVMVSFATAMGGDNRTPNHAGTIGLVSGARVVTNVAGNFALFAGQGLGFVPEPGKFALLGTGAVLVAMLGRRRHRRSV